MDNARADHLSRLRDRDDWRLNPVIFQQIVERFGKPQVDLFATRNNAQVKHFFSRFVDEDALGTDALAQYWLQDLVYGNPPWRLIMPVLRKLATEPHGRCILVLPKRGVVATSDAHERRGDAHQNRRQHLSGGITGSVRGYKKPPWDVVIAHFPARPHIHPSPHI